jgi:hypothetical protein
MVGLKAGYGSTLPTTWAHRVDLPILPNILSTYPTTTGCWQKPTHVGWLRLIWLNID